MQYAVPYYCVYDLYYRIGLRVNHYKQSFVSRTTHPNLNRLLGTPVSVARSHDLTLQCLLDQISVHPQGWEPTLVMASMGFMSIPILSVVLCSIDLSYGIFRVSCS
jgi:hypothetical protein